MIIYSLVRPAKLTIPCAFSVLSLTTSEIHITIFLKPANSLTMGNIEKHESGSINVSEKAATFDNRKDGPSALETQTRTRRLFSLPQLFSFSLVYMATWYCVAM